MAAIEIKVHRWRCRWRLGIKTHNTVLSLLVFVFLLLKGNSLLINVTVTSKCQDNLLTSWEGNSGLWSKLKKNPWCFLFDYTSMTSSPLIGWFEKPPGRCLKLQTEWTQYLFCVRSWREDKKKVSLQTRLSVTSCVVVVVVVTCRRLAEWQRTHLSSRSAPTSSHASVSFAALQTHIVECF